MDLLKEQQETERSELSYRLKLEQDEETEKLRKVSQCVYTLNGGSRISLEGRTFFPAV